MTEVAIDYEGVFQSLPGMAALLTPELIYLDANEAFLHLSGRTRDQLIGRYLFDVFPDNPNDPGADGVRNLAASLERVLASGERDVMALQRYDVESTDRPGEWEERYWSPVNAPVLGPDGKVELLIHRVEEVTELIHAHDHPTGDRTRALEAELYTRVRELQEVNAQLRQANARERVIALSLQRSMLPAPGPVRNHPVAVRYRPATVALNVCGDWYDLVDLADSGTPGGDRIGVSVGDVVGHGLEAAGVMGQLRSALSAASRVATGPAHALEVLGRYSRSVEGAQSTTVVTVFVDWDHQLITYSSAGHPPPALLRGGSRVEFLDQATDPPLDARPELTTRPQAVVPFSEGDVLVLYTDGLIERRDRDIDVGLNLLAESLVRHRDADSEALADAVLTDLLPPAGVTDDTALVIVRL
ncbi:PP2C family protein-serine/threonine phosphatase [Streptacidiphilus fuscans]|uniref:SpoIIE family protein phosphatase n=1 Tax=Streptacidiphilus fuscans TaxID=2789292 RepID=A0A931FF82_9ACTN|nr:SpoIIE family protein phosphatase [Streptacidiphilus fuscans]MBF9069531.1 SpoIIE family protein phosphatase [Streptacidiphilus fuscans]